MVGSPVSGPAVVELVNVTLSLVGSYDAETPADDALMRFRTSLMLSWFVQLIATPFTLKLPLAAMPPPTLSPAELRVVVVSASPSNWLLAIVNGPVPVCAAPVRWSADRRLLVSVAAPSCIGLAALNETPLAPRLSVTAPPVAVEIFD